MNDPPAECDFPCSSTFQDYFEELQGRHWPPLPRWSPQHEESCRRVLEGISERQWEQNAGLRTFVAGGLRPEDRMEVKKASAPIQIPPKRKKGFKDIRA